MVKRKDKDKEMIEIGKVVPTSQVAFKAVSRRGTKYQTVIDKMGKLKPGQSVIVPVPDGVPTRVVHNRMNAAIRRSTVPAPKGCRFIKRTTETNEIAICCVQGRRRIRPIIKKKSPPIE